MEWEDEWSLPEWNGLDWNWMEWDGVDLILMDRIGIEWNTVI